MRTLPVLQLVLLAAVAALFVACVSPASSPVRPAVAPTPQVAGGSPVSLTQPPMVRPPGVDASLLLVGVEDPGPAASLDQQQLGVLRARPIDPLTLQDIPGFTPLELGHHYRAALSPDWRTLATMVWPSGSGNAGGVLHLVDPIAWTDRATDVKIDEAATWLGWSGDGTQLFWLGPVGSDPNLSQYAVFATGIATPAARQVVSLPSGFEPYDAQLLGSRLTVIGATNQSSLATEDATVVFIDLSARRVSSLLRLDGLRVGQLKVSEPNLYPYRMILPGLAWDLPRGRLVVADAERDMVHIVDLARGTESGPLAIRRAGAAKGPGFAKMTSTTRKLAALSADGRWLYVSGLREDVPAQGGDAQLTPISLQRIDLTTTTETARVEGGAGLWLSSDGTRVVLGGDAMRLLNATDLSEITRGSMAFAGIVTGERDGIVYFARTTFVGTSTLRATELASGRVAATREIARHIAELIALR